LNLKKKVAPVGQERNKKEREEKEAATNGREDQDN
jgi:hypothetical protein